MPNLILEVEKVANQMRRGWPAGTEELHRDIPKLLNRIQELENALVPFARVALVEAESDKTLVHVYKKDCVTAWQMLDRAQGIQPKRDDFFDMPAEG